MPRFMLYPNPSPGEAHADTRVEVAWGRDSGDVVIAATKLRPGAHRDWETTVPDENGHAYRAWEGEFVPLTRDKINQLIRELRRARDQAYGADQ